MTDQRIVIRQMDDLLAVRQIGVQCGLEDSGREEEDVLAAWGAYADDRLVGAIVLERREGMDTVNWMSVDEAHRRRGVASRLYAALELDARKRGMRSLWVTARAPAFFVAQGFTIAPPGRRRDVLLGECPRCEQYGRTCTPQALIKQIDDFGPNSDHEAGGQRGTTQDAVPE